MSCCNGQAAYKVQTRPIWAFSLVKPDGNIVVGDGPVMLAIVTPGIAAIDQRGDVFRIEAANILADALWVSGPP